MTLSILTVTVTKRTSSKERTVVKKEEVRPANLA